MALSDADSTSGTSQPVSVLVVKMNTPTPVYGLSTLPAPNLYMHSGRIGWISITPDARELVVKYAADNVSGPSDNDECIQVFLLDTDSTSAGYLQVTGPRVFCRKFGPEAVLFCPYMGCGKNSDGSALNPAAGWVHPLKHADMMMDGSQPVLVGVNGCGGVGNEIDVTGEILEVNLTFGTTSRLSSTSDSCISNGHKAYCDEASAMHVSCRNSERPGWAYATYDSAYGARFSDEIVALPLDTSGAVERVERFAFTHAKRDSFIPPSTTVTIKNSEPQAVPSRDGGRVLWASNWMGGCSGTCGPKAEIKAYVDDATGCGAHLVASQLAMTGQQGSGSGQGLVGGRSPVPLENHPNPFRSGTTIEFELSAGAMVRLEVFDAQGRRVARLADSYLLPGPHRVAWDQRVASGLLAAPGVYIYRLTAGAFHDQRQMVLLQ